MAKMIRAFLAVSLEDKTHEWLAETQKCLISRVPRSYVRWVDTANIHVTVKFIGDIQETLIPDLFEAVHHAIELQTPFSLEARGVGCFPNPSRPRVVWVGIKHSYELNRMKSNVELELLKLRIPKEKRAFSAHLTLGRVREGVSKDRLISLGELILNSGCPKDELNIPVNSICLFQSALHPGGAEYSVLFKQDLKSPSP